jgi:hypothetical protein
VPMASGAPQNLVAIVHTVFLFSTRLNKKQ